MVLLLGAPADTSALPGDVRVEARPIARVWLRSPELDRAALAAAVRARLADKEVLIVGAPAGPHDGLAALCHVTLHGEGALQLEVILGDGRLYQRTIAARSEGRERAAARLIASTLAAIEDASATPDRRDGVFAVPVAEGPPTSGPSSPTDTTNTPRPTDTTNAPRPTDTTNTPRPTDTTPPSARSVLPDPPPGAALQPDPRPNAPASADATSRPAAAPDDRSRHAAASLEPASPELGVALDLGPGFGLGAPGAGLGLAGGGGGLRVDLRLRRGVTVGAGFRGHARLRDELVLGRFRGALVVGHVLRRGHLELALLAGPTLETWQVTQRGAPVAYTTTSSSGASLLIGGLARAALGGRLRRPRLSARIGAYLELAGSARSSGRAAQIARTDAQGAATPVFVLGGAELSVGVEVELWLALARRR
jgi:hypothetical protein